MGREFEPAGALRVGDVQELRGVHRVGGHGGSPSIGERAQSDDGKVSNGPAGKGCSGPCPETRTPLASQLTCVQRLLALQRGRSPGSFTQLTMLPVEFMLQATA
ncbi:hypothetical protein GCM10010321_01810 [Streptomyces chartreusis]|nr:hypothetical protein GCM10010321_01810 [Streptomyces chartreusis]